MSTYCTFCSIAYPYEVSIQHKLKPTDSPKRSEFCQWLNCYTHGNVSVFDALFLSEKAWFHVDGYITHKSIMFRVWKTSHFFNNVVISPKNWRLKRHESQTCSETNFFRDNNYCRGIMRYYLAIYCTFA